MLLLQVIYPPRYEPHLYKRTPRCYERKVRAGQLFAHTFLVTFLVTNAAELLRLGIYLLTYSVVWALLKTFVPSHTLLMSA